MDSEYQAPLANLQELFGTKYVVSRSPEYEGRRRIPPDPFFQIIRCRNGVTVWPYGKDKLGVTVQGKMIDRLLKTGLIIQSESTICRDDPDAWKRSEIFKLIGNRYRDLCPWNVKPSTKDLESNLDFHVKDFDAIAKIVHPRRRRVGQKPPKRPTPGPKLV